MKKKKILNAFLSFFLTLLKSFFLFGAGAGAGEKTDRLRNTGHGWEGYWASTTVEILTRGGKLKRKVPEKALPRNVRHRSEDDDGTGEARVAQADPLVGGELGHALTPHQVLPVVLYIARSNASDARSSTHEEHRIRIRQKGRQRSSLQVGRKTWFSSRPHLPSSARKKRMTTWQNRWFLKMDDHPVHITPNQHPPKMDVLPKICL